MPELIHIDGRREFWLAGAKFTNSGGSAFCASAFTRNVESILADLAEYQVIKVEQSPCDEITWIWIDFDLQD